MKEITNQELKHIMISILDEIDTFCRVHKLNYFLVGGTLLGAVRHKGFIPWDDDMDIGMPRKDYEFLLKNFHSSSGNIIIEDFRSRKNYIWPNAKAIDKRTILNEFNTKKTQSGVFVDVFPFDGISGDYNKVKKIVWKSNRWKNILTLKYMEINKERSFVKNLVVALGKIFHLIPDSFLIEKINYGLSHPLELNTCEYVCNFTGAWGIREISKSSNFIQTQSAIFEDRVLQIPIGYDDYLSTVYGDYMTPPPEGKRGSTHTGQAYWR